MLKRRRCSGICSFAVSFSLWFWFCSSIIWTLTNIRLWCWLIYFSISIWHNLIYFSSISNYNAPIIFFFVNKRSHHLQNKTKKVEYIYIYKFAYSKNRNNLFSSAIAQKKSMSAHKKILNPIQSKASRTNKTRDDQHHEKKKQKNIQSQNWGMETEPQTNKQTRFSSIIIRRNQVKRRPHI